MAGVEGGSAGPGGAAAPALAAAGPGLRGSDGAVGRAEGVRRWLESIGVLFLE